MSAPVAERDGQRVRGRAEVVERPRDVEIGVPVEVAGHHLVGLRAPNAVGLHDAVRTEHEGWVDGRLRRRRHEQCEKSRQDRDRAEARPSRALVHFLSSGDVPRGIPPLRALPRLTVQ